MGKLYEQYIYKFYLTASHSIMIGDSRGPIHSHTWEITIDVTNSNDTFIEFNEIEKRIEGILSKYQKTYLNEISPLDKINPTLENLCEYFKDLIKIDLAKVGFVLLMIEMSETASRSYIINLAKDGDEEDFKLDKDGDGIIDSLEMDEFLDNLYNARI